MARYVTLIRFTEKGARTIRNSPARAQAFREAAEKAGIKVEAQLWTAGSCDGILVLNGRDEPQVLGVIAKLASQGNVRTETLPAFDAAEFARIVK